MSGERKPPRFPPAGEDHANPLEKAALWIDGEKVSSDMRVADVVAYFRDKLGVNLGTGPIDVECHRGEDAAERWAAREIE